VIAVTTILCWAPPLLDLAGGHRNLIHLATAGSSGEVFGPAFGLRVVSSALWGVPLIVVRYSASRFPFTSETPWVGGAFGIVLLLGLGALCRWRKASGPAAAAWIVASAAIGEAISFAMVLKIRFLVVGYLDVMLWPLSAAAFAVTVWCVSALVRSAPWAKSLRIPKRFPAGVATAGLVGCVLCGIIAVERITTTQPGGPGALEAGRASIAIATQIEKTVPLGPVNLEVTGPTGSTLGLGDAQTIAYRLRVDGWSPGLPDFAARSLGPTYEWKPGSPLAHVTVSPLANHTSVSISR